MRKIWIAMCFLAPFVVVAQEVAPKSQPPQMPIIIDQADIDAFRDIVESTVPAKYTSGLIRWWNALIQRRDARQAEMARALSKEPPP